MDKDNKIPFDFTNKDVKLGLQRGLKKWWLPCSVENNTVTSVFYGKDQKLVGGYTLFLTVNDGGPNMNTIDADIIINIVPSKPSKSNIKSTGDVAVEVLDLYSSFEADKVVGVIDIDSDISDTSTNPVQNRTIKKYVDEKTAILNKLNSAAFSSAEAFEIKGTALESEQKIKSYVDKQLENVELKGAAEQAVRGVTNWVVEQKYITNSEVEKNYQKKGNYLTHIPDEYITDADLLQKNFATKKDLEKLDLSHYYTKEEVNAIIDSIDFSDNNVDINGESIPYLIIQDNDNPIVAGSFDDVFNALKNDEPALVLWKSVDGVSPMLTEIDSFEEEPTIKCQGHFILQSLKETEIRLVTIKVTKTGEQYTCTSTADFLPLYKSFKTINGESVIGEGDIRLPSSSTIEADTEMSDVSENVVQNKAIKKYIDSFKMYTISSFTAQDITETYHGEEGSETELKINIKDGLSIEEAIKDGKIILIRAARGSNNVYTCDVTLEEDLVIITYHDVAAHIVSFSFDVKDLDTDEAYIGIRCHAGHLPQGGKAGQVLTKTGDYLDSMKWADLPQPEVVVDTTMSETSTNPVQNKTIKSYVDNVIEEVEANQIEVEDVVSLPDSPMKGERLILEWSNENAEVLQPVSYDSATGYFTTEQMPSWLSEDGQIVDCALNYGESILWNNTAINNVPFCLNNGTPTQYIKRISATEFKVMSNKSEASSQMAIIANPDCSLFFYTNASVVAKFALQDEDEDAPVGVRKYKVEVSDSSLAFGRIFGGINSSKSSVISNIYNRNLGYRFANENRCFGVSGEFTFEVDYDNGRYRYLNYLISGMNRTAATTTSEYVQRSNNTERWSDMWGFGKTKADSMGKAYFLLPANALTQSCKVKIYEIYD